ncbi:MAG: hypothetical protein Q8L90_06160 [Bacteroidota bacterium]|nr:hypothetical protein [Bacteroidota bacterium]
MKLKIISALILISPCVNYSFAQGKKDIKKTKMKSMTEFVTITENGKENTYKAYYVAFNKNSEIVEETEYNNNGSIKKGETTKYDLNNNKIEETHFEQKEKKNPKNNSEPIENINIKTIYKYNAHNDKTEESELDITKAKQRKKHLYSYNNKGEKDQEETYNAENKMIKKETFIYNNKGLKVEKKTFNGNNELETTKKYVYEFY